MKVITPHYEILTPLDSEFILSSIELAGRTCYKSEEKISFGSAKSFCKRLIYSGHHSVLEHINITVRFVCDRGISHELVRHRLAAFSQESTRYANYSKDKFGNEITVIKPFFWPEDSTEYSEWYEAMKQSERSYMQLVKIGATPEQARSVLPNSLKTEVVMTCNIREWRHVLKLRCSKKAHPQIREIMKPLLSELKNSVPVLFDDISPDD